jgi:hypothetical protein
MMVFGVFGVGKLGAGASRYGEEFGREPGEEFGKEFGMVLLGTLVSSRELSLVVSEQMIWARLQWYAYGQYSIQTLRAIHSFQ